VSQAEYELCAPCPIKVGKKGQTDRRMKHYAFRWMWPDYKAQILFVCCATREPPILIIQTPVVIFLLGQWGL